MRRDALRWVDAYVDRLGDAWFTGDAVLRTVAEVAESYLAELEESAPPNTLINRKSNLTRHVVPAFGDQPLEALSGPVVQEWVSGLLTVRGRPMKRATKQTVLAALGEVWKHAHPGRPAPWRGAVTIEVTGGALARSLGEKQRRAVIEKLRTVGDNEERLVLATGRFIGEGFDDARLDTRFLTMPVAWKGTLVQYAGRLHRAQQGKTEVRIYDYVDRAVPMLARMFKKRLKGYRAMGYRIAEAPRADVRDLMIEYDDGARSWDGEPA